ncbi:MAG: hypothetical protein K1X33_06490 [Methanobacteriaceae archaeon]|nr:hypothetical protein [Methanobacteriaceae archaeon]
MNINNIIVDHINNGVHKKFIKAHQVGDKINIRYLRSISKLIPISEVFENNFKVKIIHKDKFNVTLSNEIYSDTKLFTENLNKINTIKDKDIHKTYRFMFKDIEYSFEDLKELDISNEYFRVFKNIDFIVNTKKMNFYAQIVDNISNNKFKYTNINKL